VFRFSRARRLAHERVPTAGRDGAFAGQVFQKADHEHFEVNHGVDGRTAFFSAAIERRAEVTDFRGEVHFAEGLIELVVESGWLGRVPGC